MLPTIYTNNNTNVLEEFLTKELEGKNLITLEPDGQSIKIKQVRTLLNQITTVPKNVRWLWIKEAEKLTIAAQNSILKLTEEPPAKTNIVLSTIKPNSLIITIRSRCIIKRVGENSSLPLDEDALKIIKTALTANEAERLDLASEITKDRHEALSWITTSISSLHQTLEKTNSQKSLKILHSTLSVLLKTKKYLESNCNVTLSLEYLFLNLPKAK